MRAHVSALVVEPSKDCLKIGALVQEITVAGRIEQVVAVQLVLNGFSMRIHTYMY